MYHLCLTAVRVFNTCGSLKMAASLQSKHEAVKLVVQLVSNKLLFCSQHNNDFPCHIAVSSHQAFPHTFSSQFSHPPAQTQRWQSTASVEWSCLEVAHVLYYQRSTQGAPATGSGGVIFCIKSCIHSGHQH